MKWDGPAENTRVRSIACTDPLLPAAILRTKPFLLGSRRWFVNVTQLLSHLAPRKA